MLFCRKGLFLAAFAFILLFAAGCETAKGYASGVCSTAEGVGKDSTNAFSGLMAADEWFKKNLW
jgi:predicted small secreted protein